MNIFVKFKGTLMSVVPIMLIVIMLDITVAHMGFRIIGNFIAGSIFLVVGLTLFLVGIDIGILPVGEQCGAKLTAKKNLLLLLVSAFVIGFIVTIAEPSVQVLTNQVGRTEPEVVKWKLVFMIAGGVGVFVALGLLRTILQLSLRLVLIAAYAVVFFLVFVTPEKYVDIAFDAGGATTGAITVPFIIAFGIGVSAVHESGKRNSQNESFGLTGVASIGPIAAVLVYGLLLSYANSDTVHGISDTCDLVAVPIFFDLFPAAVKDAFLSVLPLAVMFIFAQFFLIRFPRGQVIRITKGFFYAFFGLVLFLLGVNGGFMPAGSKLGSILGSHAVQYGGLWNVLLVGTGVVLGAVVVCAEPAVWALTDQVEAVSGGTIKRRMMLTFLATGSAVAIGLTMMRTIIGFSLLKVLVPGYALALLLTFFCPPLFTGIAFDSGGVASGAITSTFVLSFTQGACVLSGEGGAASSFGSIALVAMTPLIMIQVLGLIYRRKGKEHEFL